MRISRVEIINFRNFRHLEVELGEHAVIVGENKIGKTNFLYALRLVLDPTLSESARRLQETDFWDGLPRPLDPNERIAVSVDLTDFEDNENQMAVLADHLIESSPLTARLTYGYGSEDSGDIDSVTQSRYDYVIYGGGRSDNPVGYEVRHRIPMDVLQALRDAEDELVNWRRSPMRPLIERARQAIETEELAEIARQFSEASKAVANQHAIKSLGEQITGRLREMVGPGQAVQTALGLAPTDPERMIRALRVFIDGQERPIGSASLGIANVLYLVLKSLELRQLAEEAERDHTFLAIEEPEAHLHPHLQRLVYRDFLQPRAHQVARSQPGFELPQTILLTTHSPHIVSVAPLNSLVLLRRSSDGSTKGVSTAKAYELFKSAEIADLERYLDVKRGEFLFARGVLLVEGDAEEFLVPVIARNFGYDLDELGITVCSVAGAYFVPYVNLLGPSMLDIPFAVLTDLDPLPDGRSMASSRIIKLLTVLEPDVDYRKMGKDLVLAKGAEWGIFPNSHTLEVELFESGAAEAMCETLLELADSTAARERANFWRANHDLVDKTQLLKDIGAIGKGRFAQRLTSRIEHAAYPEYICRAIEHVRKRT